MKELSIGCYQLTRKHGWLRCYRSAGQRHLFCAHCMGEARLNMFRPLAECAREEGRFIRKHSACRPSEQPEKK